MKKRILALLLAFSMMLSLLPVSALADTGGGIDFAAYASNEPLPDLVMGSNGMPDLSRITPVSPGVYQGDGWKYENSTLTLESGSYDFFTTKPTTKNGKVLALVECTVVVKNGATITGGRFHAMFNYGTVENSLLVSDGIINRGGTMTNCLFRRTSLPEGVTDYHKLTEVNNSTFDATLPNAPYIFSSCKTYYFTGTPKLVVKLAKLGGDFDELHYINGRVDYGGLTGPDSGYYTFTPEKEEDIVLNDTIIHEPFTMTNGYPTASNGGKTACKGEGWKYENGTLTLECRCRPVTSCFTSVQNGFSLDGLLDGIGKFINNIGNSIVGSDNAPIEVILPKVYWGAVEAESRNARITMEGITCSQGITLSTTNARVVLSDVVAREASVHTTNGRIELHDVYAREGMNAGGTNGQIIAENLNTDQKLRLATTNGRVTLDNVSGQDIDIRTSNGSVSGTVHGEREAFTIHSHTSNAGNNLMNREGGDRRLNIVTSNGAVNVSFTGTQEA